MVLFSLIIFTPLYYIITYYILDKFILSISKRDFAHFILSFTIKLYNIIEYLYINITCIISEIYIN